jgi:hypothetical protein
MRLDKQSGHRRRKQSIVATRILTITPTPQRTMCSSAAADTFLACARAPALCCIGERAIQVNGRLLAIWSATLTDWS